MNELSIKGPAMKCRQKLFATKPPLQGTVIRILSVGSNNAPGIVLIKAHANRIKHGTETQTPGRSGFTERCIFFATT